MIAEGSGSLFGAEVSLIEHERVALGFPETPLRG